MACLDLDEEEGVVCCGCLGGSEANMCSCQRALKKLRRCRAMETKEGTASLLLGCEWYWMQLEKILQASSCMSRRQSYSRFRIFRHTTPRSTGWSTILE